MSQILKLAGGDLVKNKKQQDLDQIAANREKIQQAYDSGKLTDDQKAQLDMISQNAQSYLAADPMHNRNARKFQLELTNRMADIVDGKSGYTPYSTEVADKNIFGRYSDQEMGLIANELVRQTLGGRSNGISATSTQTPSQSTSTENMHHQYDWLGGTNLDLLPASATIKDKVKAVIAGLNKGISDAETAHAAGKRVHGFDPTKFESAKARLASLTIADEDDDDAAFRKLIGQVLDGLFAIPADTFKSLFSKYYTSLLSSESTSKNPVIYRDQMLTNYLTNKGLKLNKTKDGKYILTDSSGEKAAESFAETDPSSSYYQWGFFIDPQTGEILGADNLNNPDYVAKFAEQWTELIPKIREEYRRRFPIVDYTTQGGKKGIDFSAYFPGSDVRFRETGDFDYDNPETSVWIPFENWFDDWNTIKSKFNYKGLADVSTSGSNTSNQYAKSMGIDSDLDLTSILTKYNPAELNTELTKLSPKISEIVTKTSGNRDYANNLIEYITASICFADPNNTNKSVHNQTLSLFPKMSKTHKTFGTEGNAVISRLKSNPDVMKLILSLAIKYAQTPEDRRSLIKAYKSFEKSILQHKNGGLLYMLNGGSTDWADNYWNSLNSQSSSNKQTDIISSLSEKNIEASRQYESEEGFEWKPEDTLRVISLTTDIAGILSSNAVGWGTLGAGVAGLVSTGLDYAADKIDKTVTNTQRIANLGVGLGTTALGLIPDAKALTTGAKSLKFLAGLTRRGLGLGAMVGAGFIAADDVSRLNELLSNPDSREFTGDDLRLIFNTTRSIASAILGKKMSNKNRAISDTVSKNTRYFKTKGVDGSEVKVELTRDQFDKIIEAGKSKGQKEADELFRLIAGNTVASDARFPVDFGNSLYGKAARNTQHFVERYTLGWPGSTSYETYQRIPNTEVELAAKGPDKALATWGQWEGLNINLPKWLDYVTTAAPEIKKVNVKQTASQPTASTSVPKQSVKTTSSKSTTKKKTSEKPAKKEVGGKLERLNNYIKKK